MLFPFLVVSKEYQCDGNGDGDEEKDDDDISDDLYDRHTSYSLGDEDLWGGATNHVATGVSLQNCHI